MGDESRCCLALYAREPNSISPLAWFDFALNWCSRLGLPPDAACLSIGGESGAPLMPADARAQLVQLRGSSVGGIEIYRTLPQYKQLVFDWEVASTLHPEQGVVTFAFPTPPAGSPPSRIPQITEDAVRLGDIGYGMAYERDLGKGPVLYAVGMSAGLGYSDEDMREADLIARWMFELMEERRHLRGLLRDIYPLNVLTEPHLLTEVGTDSLASWIRSSEAHGLLRELPAGCWLWEIASQNIKDVRTELSRAGILLCAD